MSNDAFRAALESASEMRITFTGRKSGKKFSTPVWFVLDGSKLYLVPLHGKATNWYRNVLKIPTMELEASRKKVIVKAVPVEEEKRVEEIVDRFRSKYGAADVKRYYPRHDAAVELSV